MSAFSEAAPAISAFTSALPPPDAADGTPDKLTWKVAVHTWSRSFFAMDCASSPSWRLTVQLFVMTALGSVTVPRSTVMLLSPFPPVEESTMFKPLMLSTYITLDGITIGTLTLALLFSSTVSVALLLTGSFGGNAEFVRCGERGSPAADLSIQIFAATVYVPAFSFPFWLESAFAFSPFPLLVPLLSFLLVFCFLSPDGFLSPLVLFSGNLTSVLSEVFFALVKSTPS